VDGLRNTVTTLRRQSAWWSWFEVATSVRLSNRSTSTATHVSPRGWPVCLYRTVMHKGHHNWARNSNRNIQTDTSWLRKHQPSKMQCFKGHSPRVQGQVNASSIFQKDNHPLLLVDVSRSTTRPAVLNLGVHGPPSGPWTRVEKKLQVYLPSVNSNWNLAFRQVLNVGNKVILGPQTPKMLVNFNESRHLYSMDLNTLFLTCETGSVGLTSLSKWSMAQRG